MSGWKNTTLGEIADGPQGFVDGPFGSNLPVSDYVDAGVPVIRGSNLSLGVSRFSANDFVFVSEQTAERLRRSTAIADDIVFTKKGTIGQTGFVPNIPNFPIFVLSSNQMRLRVDITKADPLFVYYYVSQRTSVDKVIRDSEVTGVPKTNLTYFRTFPIALPPLADQHIIASILGAMDDKIELNRRMNETLEAMARAIFKDWFVDFGPTRAKMEGRVPYLAPEIWALFPDRLDDVDKPEGWQLRPVSDFAEIRGGKQLDKEHIIADGPVPVFGGAGLMGFTTKHNADGFVISIGRVGAYCGQFFSFRGKAWINNNASLIRPMDNVSGEWLFFALRNANIDLIKKGAAQPFVSNGDVANIHLIWPGREVISALSEVVVPLVLKAEQNDNEKRTLAQIREFLLPKLMSGELRIKDAAKIAEATL